MSIFDLFKNTVPKDEAYGRGYARAGELLLQTEPGLAYAIGKMIKLTQKIIPFESETQFSAYSNVIISCCEAAARARTITELNADFTQKRLVSRINTYLPSYSKRLDGALIRNRPRGDDGSYARQVRQILMNTVEKVSNSAAEIKLLYALSSNMIEKSEAGYKQAYLATDAAYRDEFFAITDALATGIAAARLLFAEKMSREVKEGSEFLRLLDNLSEKYDDTSIVVEKSFNLYKFFYKKELGDITDKLLYGSAVYSILRRAAVKKGDLSDYDIAVQFQPASADTYYELKGNLERWIGKTAKDHPDEHSQIKAWIAGRIVKTATEPHVMLLGLRDLDEYERIYDETVQYNAAIKQRERYLRGEVD